MEVHRNWKRIRQKPCTELGQNTSWKSRLRQNTCFTASQDVDIPAKQGFHSSTSLKFFGYKFSCRVEVKVCLLSLILLCTLCRPKVVVSPDFSSNMIYPWNYLWIQQTLIKLSTWLSDFVSASVQCCNDWRFFLFVTTKSTLHFLNYYFPSWKFALGTVVPLSQIEMQELYMLWFFH